MKVNFILTIFCLTTYSNVFSQDPTTPEVQGAKIGLIVKSAIDAAMPGITPILNLIFKNNREKLNEADVRKRLDQLHQNFIDSLKSVFQERLKPSVAIHQELSIMNQFLLPTETIKVLSSKNLERLTKDSIDIDWVEINLDFEEISKRLDNIAGVNLTPIREVFIKTTYNKIKDKIIISVKPRLADYIKSKNKIKTIEYFGIMLNSVSDITTIFQFNLESLYSEFKAFSNWFEGGMSNLNEIPLTQVQNRIMNDLNAKY